MMSILGRVVRSGIASKSRKFSSAAAAPWLMLPPSFRDRGEMEYNLYSPSKEEVVRLKGKGGEEEADVMRDEATRLVGSSHGWLALVNKRTGDMRLSNPLSGRSMKLPPFRRPLMEEDDDELFKVIISCSPDEEGCRALMFPWCEEAGIFHRSRVLEGWDMSGGGGFPRRILDTPEMDMFGEGPTKRDQTYLIAAGDQLYVVRLYVEDPQRASFDVFRSDERGGLEVCSSLEGLVMFVGSNHSMALPSSQYPELKPNSIYLSDHTLLRGKPFIGVFDYQNRSWSPFCYPPTLQLQNSASQYPLTWFTPTTSIN